MFKKHVYSIIIIFLLPLVLKGQSFRKKPSRIKIMGYGATIGSTLCTQIWDYSVTDQTETKDYRFGYNGSLFLEWLNYNTWRWITEVQYNQKGAITYTLTDEKLDNKIEYICLNNFLKIREQELTITPYIIGGPRIEYLLSQNTPAVVGAFKRLHVSVSVGAGVEFLHFNPWLPFVEFQYNPDVTNAFRDKALNDLSIMHRAFELRIGIKYVPGKGEKCPPAAH